MPQKLSERILDAMPWLDAPAEAVQKTLAPLLGPEGRKGVKDMLNGRKLSEQILDAMPWLDGPAETVQKTLASYLGAEGRKDVQDILNGTWFGHPLHPAIVVLPLGFWTTTMMLDLAGQEDAADLSLGLGVLGALAAAATGAAQWQDTWGKARRLGFLHASLNLGAAGIYTGSWMLRAQGARKMGVLLSSLGFGVGLFSAWLGGDLAYDLGIGVNRTAFQEPPSDWTEVLNESDLAENTPRRVVANGVPIMLLRRGGEIFAIAATCSHLGGPLDEGQLADETVTCPWHGSVFSVRDGTVLHGPATMPQPAFDVRVQGGRIAVRARGQ
jgi:nitrite reductase/ring-hydroxylating ferredoxin subunit/uncharacterized membrane protein